jgi:GTP-binding protein
MALQEKAMKVLSAQFMKAAERQKDYPTGGLPEVAFAGRSNVGKSSMINTLLGRRNLVRTSKTPGLTRMLNFYLINDRFIFVDLPGYGYARVPLQVKKKWGPMVETYLNTRKELTGVVVIMDARRPPHRIGHGSYGLPAIFGQTGHRGSYQVGQALKEAHGEQSRCHQGEPG